MSAVHASIANASEAAPKTIHRMSVARSAAAAAPIASHNCRLLIDMARREA
jgi:hypothetical protein